MPILQPWFLDCSDIAKNSRYNHKSREKGQFGNGMESGLYDENLIFPPSGLGQLVVKCFFPQYSIATRAFNHFKLNGEFGGWTIIAKGSGTTPLVSIRDASTEQQEQGSTHRLVRAPVGASSCDIFQNFLVRHVVLARTGSGAWIPEQGHIFGSSNDHYWIGFHNALYLTSLYSHKEKTALKINIKIRSQELR